MGWLSFSSHTRFEGRRLRSHCYEFGLKQVASHPTRGAHLLGHVRSPRACSAQVIPGVSDHEMVLAEFPVSPIRKSRPSGTVWSFHRAVCFGLRDAAEQFSAGGAVLLEVHDHAHVTTTALLQTMHKLVPKKKHRAKETLATPKKTHNQKETRAKPKKNRKP